MTAPSVPRIRARKPKVRSGCTTCKSRRVKCDEGRPRCRRCQKGDLPCQYGSPGPKQGGNQSEQGIVPKSQTDDNNMTRLLLGIGCNQFRGDEVFYFDLFRNIVVRNLCLNGYENLWSRTILCESFRDECVRDSVLGTGALCRALMEQVYQSKRPGPGPAPLWTFPAAAISPLSSKYHRAALQFYTKAISKFRSRMFLEGASIPPRTILIVSVLFIIFESMQGNMEAIDRLMHSTILTLESSMSSLNSGSKVSTALDDEGVREADYFVARMSGFNSLLSPFYPSLLKSEVYQKDWLLRDAVPNWSETPQEIEQRFERYTTSIMLWCFRAIQNNQFHRPVDLAKFEEEQQFAIAQASRWCEFIAGKLKQETDPAQTRTWKIRLVEAKMYSIYVSYRQDLDEQERRWDARLDECREAVNLAESVLETPTSPDGTLPPLFEDKLLPVLRSLVCKCRDYETRSRALGLCQRISGPWFENKAMLVGLRALVELEERYRDASGHIPIQSRYRWSSSSWDESRTELRMVLTGIKTGTKKELTIRREENIDDLIKTVATLSL